MVQVIAENLDANDAEKRIKQYCQTHQVDDVAKFVSHTLADFSGLHEGRIMGLGITLSKFKQWQACRP